MINLIYCQFEFGHKWIELSIYVEKSQIAYLRNLPKSFLIVLLLFEYTQRFEKEGKLIFDKGSGTVKLKVQIFCRLLLVSERGFFCATIGLSRVCSLLPDSGKFRYFALK